ncbi:unnamed protein product [Spirodela intermedia]|uniref:CRM domain-containing protein n=1 Tax=Spirodela intermedia TaxID=51605 RepID=A0A7I8KY82_SPIIN|nr:unnamed protein product [Spirodela intermedia]
MAGAASSLLHLPHCISHRTQRLLSSPLNTQVATTSATASASASRSRPCLALLLSRSDYDGARQGARDDSSSTPAERPWAQSGGGFRMPTAPWMRGPLVLPPGDVLDLSKPRSRKRNGKPGEKSLTEKVRGGRSRLAMKKIVQSIARLGELSHLEQDESMEELRGEVSDGGKSPMEEVLDRRSRLATKNIIQRIARLGELNRSDIDEEEKEDEIRTKGDPAIGNQPFSGKMPWVGSEKPLIFPRVKKPRTLTAAELILPEPLLARLRMEARKLNKWVKAKKAGVTDDVVDEIRATWRREELAMVRFVEPLCRNMDRAREIIEIKTGGLVIWSKKDTLVVLRGNNDQDTSKYIHASPHSESEKSLLSSPISELSSPKTGVTSSMPFLEDTEDHSRPESRIDDLNDCAESITGTLFEREVNRLLDGLGPRFIDWWWSTPLPVDADLLPDVVPDFRPPFRLCPPNVRSKLTDDELTHLRKLAHPLPTHFALGKNSKLQGVAAAIIKLWEKSPIAKVAVKWGILNTDNEKMANELKRLTGGVLLLRNKFFIILYRGKDFIPPKVASSVLEREKILSDIQLHEERARVKLTALYMPDDVSVASTSEIGTVKEFLDIETNYSSLRNGNSDVSVKIDAERENLKKDLRRQERQLQLIKLKLDKSEKELLKLNFKWRPSEQAPDQEFLTEEERQSLRKIGLKMDESLLLGRRGVYDGTIGSIHMHWKHREVVKVITFQRKISHITFTASLLELESGGILVAVEKLRRGHAIIIYRGKNHQAPVKLLPENLLSKGEAMERSIEIQRRGSLKFFYYQRQQSICELKVKLVSLVHPIFHAIKRKIVHSHNLDLMKPAEGSGLWTLERRTELSTRSMGAGCSGSSSAETYSTASLDCCPKARAGVSHYHSN